MSYYNLIKLASTDEELAKMEALLGYDSEKSKSEENFRKFNNPYRHTNERLQAFKDHRDYLAKQEILNPVRTGLKNAKAVGIPVGLLTTGMGALIGSEAGAKGALIGGLGGLAMGGMTALGAGLSAHDAAKAHNALVERSKSLQGLDDEKNIKAMNILTAVNMKKRQEREVQRQVQLQRAKEIARQEDKFAKKYPPDARHKEVVQNYKDKYKRPDLPAGRKYNNLDEYLYENRL